MRRMLIDRVTPFRTPTLALLCAVAVVGCVSKGTYTKTAAELEAEKKTSAQLQQQLAGLQKSLDQEAAQRKAAQQQAADLQSRLDGLESQNGQLNSELTNVRSQITDLEQ
ncbi:MAG TPA: hypothetical protein VFV44_05755, partial [Nitrospiraceae bacterium]|nr:hypothetical protein [Nitrospiraceae bacterium]